MTLDLFAPANFSADRTFRWSLSRRLSMLSERLLVSCGFNPSDAAEEANDPTIRREIDLANQLSCGWLIKLNALCAVATKPDRLAAMADPVGDLADAVLREAVQLCTSRDGIMLACWGVPKGRAVTQRLAVQRFRQVAALTDRWHALRLTASGHPEHPLYLPKGLVPQPWAGYP